MIATSFSRRVARATCMAALFVALPVTWLAGYSGGLGVLTGALLAGGNFLWLTRRAGRIGRGIATTSSGAGWAVASGLRLLAIGVVCVVLLKLEVVHPVGLVAGLTVLPGMIIVEGLRAAREDG